MTLIYNLTRIPCRYTVCKYELPTSRLSNVVVWQTDRQTDMTEIIYHAASRMANNRQLLENETIIIIIIINKVLIKVTLNKVIAGALYIVICGWNAVKVLDWQLTM